MAEEIKEAEAIEESEPIDNTVEEEQQREPEPEREKNPNNIVDELYRDLVLDIINNGTDREDRTGVGTRSLFGTRMQINIRERFPLLTFKSIYWRGVVNELLWFLKGDTNIRFLLQNNVHIWDGDAYRWYTDIMTHNNKTPVSKEEFLKKVLNNENEEDITQEVIDDSGNHITLKGYTYGDLGNVYGKEWRNWDNNLTSVDQIATAVQLLRYNPTNRRILVSAWNPTDLFDAALPPCHVLFQFYARELTEEQRKKVMLKANNKTIFFKQEPEMLEEYHTPKYELCCQWYQRSVDVGLGLPFNIASYALLTCMLAQVVNMVPGDLIFVGGDTHLYNNHIEPLKDIFTRKDLFFDDSPTITLNPTIKDIDDYTFDDIELHDYEPLNVVKLPLNVG